MTNAKLFYKTNADANISAEMKKIICAPPFRNADINNSRSYSVRSAMVYLNDFHLMSYRDVEKNTTIELSQKAFDEVYNDAFLPSCEFFGRFSDVEYFVIIEDEVVNEQRFGLVRELFGREIQSIRFVLK